MRKFIHQLICIVLVLILLPVKSFTQEKQNESVYKINRKVEIPLTLGLFGGAALGFSYLATKPGITYEQAISFTADDIWWFDRPACEQDAFKRDDAHKISDIFLNSSVILPGILAFDDNIRKDWLDLLILYGESHAINSDFYILNSALISRPRPFNYNPDVSIEDKMANESRNSFFSGHVSTAATASFFMAKVYSDYHPELGNKKYWLYAAAVIPPSLVGYYRYKAMKHFPSDILIGFAVGATAGVLIPHCHKVNRKSRLAFVPFAGRYSGLQLIYTLR